MNTQIKDGSKIRQDIPHTGWALIDCIDRATADHRCEACGYPKVRYVHKISHPDRKDPLLVGFLCGGQLTGKPDVARIYENKLKRVARHRDRFLARGWSSSCTDEGVNFAWRMEESAKFWLKQRSDKTWGIYRSARGVREKLISEGHADKDVAAIELYRLLYMGPKS